jgi:hypothetical protein
MTGSAPSVDFAPLVGRASGSLVDLAQVSRLLSRRSLMAHAMTMMIALPKMETRHGEGVPSGG